MKTFTLSTLAIMLLGATFTLGTQKPAEPSYRGKKLTVWLPDLDSRDRAVWSQAAEAVEAIGTNALPTLSTLISARDSFLKRRLM